MRRRWWDLPVVAGETKWGGKDGVAGACGVEGCVVELDCDGFSDGFC